MLRLKFEATLSNRQISNSCMLSRSTIADYLERFKSSGLSWPLENDMDDSCFEQQLFSKVETPPSEERPLPDFLYIHRELRRKGVTLMLLWQEYKQNHPDGFQYSRYYELYGKWTGNLDPVMRQEHRAGEKTFVDYARMKVSTYDTASGEQKEAEIFLAVLGASNYTYAEATWTQTLPDWIGSHVQAVCYFGGFTQILVPDNLKSGVHKPSFYEPDINPNHIDMARHYGIVVIPARVKKPKDKAKVEGAVLKAERWILARHRNRQFFSLHELNRAIRELLVELNTKAFQKLPGCRKSLFKPRTGRRCCRCLPRRTNLPRGKRPGSISTITSRWSVLITAYHIN